MLELEDKLLELELELLVPHLCDLWCPPQCLQRTMCGPLELLELFVEELELLELDVDGELDVLIELIELSIFVLWPFAAR